MSTPVPSNSPSTPASTAPASPALEHHLHGFWQKNARTIYLVCAIVLIAIIGKGAYELYERAQKRQVASDYSAATTSEKLKAFAGSHQGSELGGVAYLRLADEAYHAANYAQAIQYYQSAMENLKDGPLAGRARLGAALSKVQAGQAGDGEAQLKLLASDLKQLNVVRAEACYQLATLAVTAGKTDEAVKHLDQLNTVEPAGFWAQRALALRATLPASVSSTAVGAPTAETAIKLPGKP